jgi:hypothetical protein
MPPASSLTSLQIQILVTIGRQIIEIKARQQHHQYEVLNEIRSQFGEISSHFQGEPSLDVRLADEALDLVTKRPVLTQRLQSPRLHRDSRSLPHISPVDTLSFDCLLPSPREPTIAEQSSPRIVSPQPPNAPTRQSAPCVVPPQLPDTPSNLKDGNGKIHGNSLDLINHFVTGIRILPRMNQIT